MLTSAESGEGVKEGCFGARDGIIGRRLGLRVRVESVNISFTVS